METVSSPAFQLSTSDKQIIAKVVQGVIFLGVVPNLSPGVGLPLQRRSKLYQILRDCITAEVVNTGDNFNVKIRKYQSLLYVVTQLLSLLNLDVFSSIILTKHLGDFLAGLIQVAYSPIIAEDIIRVGYDFIT